jgi:hypothetical protein
MSFSTVNKKFLSHNGEKVSSIELHRGEYQEIINEYMSMRNYILGSKLPTNEGSKTLNIAYKKAIDDIVAAIAAFETQTGRSVNGIQLKELNNKARNQGFRKALLKLEPK